MNKRMVMIAGAVVVVGLAGIGGWMAVKPPRLPPEVAKLCAEPMESELLRRRLGLVEKVSAGCANPAGRTQTLASLAELNADWRDFTDESLERRLRDAETGLVTGVEYVDAASFRKAIATDPVKARSLAVAGLIADPGPPFSCAHPEASKAASVLRGVVDKLGYLCKADPKKAAGVIADFKALDSRWGDLKPEAIYSRAQAIEAAMAPNGAELREVPEVEFKAILAKSPAEALSLRVASDADNKVFFSGSTILDNGLKVGVGVQLEPSAPAKASEGVIDESYVWVGGGFGERLLHGLVPPAADSGNDKITYFAPTFGPDAAGLWLDFPAPCGAFSENPALINTFGLPEKAQYVCKTDPKATDTLVKSLTQLAELWPDLTEDARRKRVEAIELDLAPKNARPLKEVTYGEFMDLFRKDPASALGLKVKVESSGAVPALSPNTYAGFTIGGTYGAFPENGAGTLEGYKASEKYSLEPGLLLKSDPVEYNENAHGRIERSELPTDNPKVTCPGQKIWLNDTYYIGVLDKACAAEAKISLFDKNGRQMQSIDRIVNYESPEESRLPLMFEYKGHYSLFSAGGEVEDVKFQFVTFYGDYGIAEDGNNKWIISRNNDEILSGEDFDAFIGMKNVFRVKSGGKYGLFEAPDNWLARPSYDVVHCNKNGICVCEGGGGKKIIIPRFDKIMRGSYERADLYDGAVRACANGKCGYIDAMGEWVVKPVFDDLGDWGQTIAAEISGKYGLIDKRGEWVISPEYDKITDRGMYKIVKKNGKAGLFDESGRLITPIKYEEIGTQSERCSFGKYSLCPFSAKSGDKWFVIDDGVVTANSAVCSCVDTNYLF